MRIAYLLNTYPQGSQSFIRRELRALERQGVTVLRFALRGWTGDLAESQDRAERQLTHYLLRDGLPGLLLALCMQALQHPGRLLHGLWLACGMARGSGRPLAWHLAYLAEACALRRQLQRQGGASQLHVHFGTNAAEVALLVHALGGPPFSFTVHGPEEFDQPEGLQLGRKMAQANGVVAISAHGRAELLRWAAPRDRHKLRRVHCGLEAADFPPGPPRIPQAPRLVCIGRLCAQKAHWLLIEAAASLEREGRRFELVLVGDGELRAELQAAIAHHQLAHRVRLTGWLDHEQVRAQLACARALVLTSLAEGLPVVLMEAMASGRPVLASRVAGVAELVRDGVDGWLFDPGCARAAAQALRACLDAPVGQLQAMGRAAQERVRQRHDAEVQATRLLAMWHAAAGTSGLHSGGGDSHECRA